jgi:hypothetical protein
MFEWFLANVLSPLLLPVFLGAVLFSFVGSKPDIVIKGFFDLATLFVTLLFKWLMALAALALKLFCMILCDKSACAKGGSKKPKV